MTPSPEIEGNDNKGNQDEKDKRWIHGDCVGRLGTARNRIVHNDKDFGGMPMKKTRLDPIDRLRYVFSFTIDICFLLASIWMIVWGFLDLFLWKMSVALEVTLWCSGILMCAISALSLWGTKEDLRDERIEKEYEEKRKGKKDGE